MAIDRDTVLKAANLARLHVTDQDTSELTSRLGDILQMVDELQQADVADLAPMAHPLDVTQPLREDEVTESNIRDQAQALAPASEAGCFLVPRVIE